MLQEILNALSTALDQNPGADVTLVSLGRSNLAGRAFLDALPKSGDRSTVKGLIEIGSGAPGIVPSKEDIRAALKSLVR